MENTDAYQAEMAQQQKIKNDNDELIAKNRAKADVLNSILTVRYDAERMLANEFTRKWGEDILDIAERAELEWANQIIESNEG